MHFLMLFLKLNRILSNLLSKVIGNSKSKHHIYHIIYNWQKIWKKDSIKKYKKLQKYKILLNYVVIMYLKYHLNEVFFSERISLSVMNIKLASTITKFFINIIFTK